MRSTASLAIQPAEHVGISRRLVWALLCVGIAANILTISGGAWDLAFHIRYLVDTFWSPPHILLYAGMFSTLLLGMILLGLLFLNRRSQEGFIEAFAQRPLLLLPVIANMGFLLTGPFDDLWHRAFGRDKLTAWTVPHSLLALNIAATAVSVVALGLWLRSEHPTSDLEPPSDARSKRVLDGVLILGLSMVVTHMWPFLAEWEHGSGVSPFQDSPWLYGLVAPAIAAFCFALAARLLPGWWWLPALVALGGVLVRQVPTALVFLFGLPWGFRLDVGAVLAGCLYSLILWRGCGWSLRKRHAVFGLAFVIVILLARLLGRLPHLSTLGILIALPLMPFTALAGGFLGDALARGLQRLSGDTAQPLASDYIA